MEKDRLVALAKALELLGYEIVKIGPGEIYDGLTIHIRDIPPEERD